MVSPKKLSSGSSGRSSPKKKPASGSDDARPLTSGSFRVFDEAGPYAVYYHNWKRHTEGATWTNLELSSKTRRDMIMTDKVKDRLSQYHAFRAQNLQLKKDIKQVKLVEAAVSRQNQRSLFAKQKQKRLMLEQKSALESRPRTQPMPYPVLAVHELLPDGTKVAPKYSNDNYHREKGWVTHKKLVPFDQMAWRDESKSAEAAEKIYRKGEEIRRRKVSEELEKRDRVNSLRREFEEQKAKNARLKFALVDTGFQRKQQRLREASAHSRASFDRQVSERILELGEARPSFQHQPEVDFGHIDFKNLNIDRKTSWVRAPQTSGNRSAATAQSLRKPPLAPVITEESEGQEEEAALRRSSTEGSSFRYCSSKTSSRPASAATTHSVVSVGLFPPTSAQSTTSKPKPLSRRSSKGRQGKLSWHPDRSETSAGRWEQEEQRTCMRELKSFEQRLQPARRTVAFRPYMNNPVVAI